MDNIIDLISICPDPQDERFTPERWVMRAVMGSSQEAHDILFTAATICGSDKAMYVLGHMAELGEILKECQGSEKAWNIVSETVTPLVEVFTAYRAAKGGFVPQPLCDTKRLRAWSRCTQVLAILPHEWEMIPTFIHPESGFMDISGNPMSPREYLETQLQFDAIVKFGLSHLITEFRVKLPSRNAHAAAERLLWGSHDESGWKLLFEMSLLAENSVEKAEFVLGTLGSLVDSLTPEGLLDMIDRYATAWGSLDHTKVWESRKEYPTREELEAKAEQKLQEYLGEST